MNIFIAVPVVTVCSMFFTSANSFAVPITYSLSGEITVSPGSGYADPLESYAYLHDGDLFSGTIVYDNEFGVSSIDFLVDNEHSTFFKSTYIEQNPTIAMVYATNFNITPLSNNVGVADINVLVFSWAEDWLPVDLYGLTASGGVELCPYGASSSSIFFANFNFSIDAPSPVPEPSTIVLFSIGCLGVFSKVGDKIRMGVSWHDIGIVM